MFRLLVITVDGRSNSQIAFFPTAVWRFQCVLKRKKNIAEIGESYLRFAKETLVLTRGAAIDRAAFRLRLI
jgi:hypothetical protein